MKNLNGGYSMIDLTASTLLNDLASALALGKPVLVYDSNGKGNFYTLKENSGAYTLVGADTTYNVTSEGVITSSDTAKKYYMHTLFIEATLPSGYAFATDTIAPEYRVGAHFTSSDSEKYTTATFKDKFKSKRFIVDMCLDITHSEATTRILFLLVKPNGTPTFYFADGTHADGEIAISTSSSVMEI